MCATWGASNAIKRQSPRNFQPMKTFQFLGPWGQNMRTITAWPAKLHVCIDNKWRVVRSIVFRNSESNAIIGEVWTNWRVYLAGVLVMLITVTGLRLTSSTSWPASWAAHLLLITYVSLLVSITDSCYLFPLDQADPCTGLKCPPGARCIVSSSGNSASCHCPTK